MKVAWAKAKKKKTEVTLNELKKINLAAYEATFQQWLSEKPSVINESVEATISELQKLVRGLQVLNVDWSTDIPVISFDLDLTKPRLATLSKLSEKTKDAKKAVDLLIAAGYSAVTFNGVRLSANKKVVTSDPKLWKPLPQFVRQAFWNIYSSIYETRMEALEDQFLEENEGIYYEI